MEIINSWHQRVSGRNLSDEQLGWIQELWNKGEKE